MNTVKVRSSKFSSDLIAQLQKLEMLVRAAGMKNLNNMNFVGNLLFIRARSYNLTL